MPFTASLRILNDMSVCRSAEQISFRNLYFTFQSIFINFGLRETVGGDLDDFCSAVYNVGRSLYNTSIVKPKSSPKSKSQIKVPNPKSKIQRKGSGIGADTIILQATTPPITFLPSTNSNFNHDFSSLIQIVHVKLVKRG